MPTDEYLMTLAIEDRNAYLEEIAAELKALEDHAEARIAAYEQKMYYLQAEHDLAA